MLNRTDKTVMSSMMVAKVQNLLSAVCSIDELLLVILVMSGLEDDVDGIYQIS